LDILRIQHTHVNRQRTTNLPTSIVFTHRKHETGIYLNILRQNVLFLKFIARSVVRLSAAYYFGRTRQIIWNIFIRHLTVITPDWVPKYLIHLYVLFFLYVILHRNTRTTLRPIRFWFFTLSLTSNIYYFIKECKQKAPGEY